MIFKRISKFSNWNNVRWINYLHKNQTKTPSTELALRHYDNFYSKIYGNQWQSIRLGLLSPKKYAAIVNNFVDTESVEIELRQLGANNLRYVYQKNMAKIAKHLKREEFLQTRSKLISDYDSNEENAVSTTEELEIHSESETETLERFFTDSNEEIENLLDNKASMELDLGEFVPASELKYQEKIDDEKNYFLFYEMDYEIPISSVEQSFLEISPFLNLYTFDRADFQTFPPAKIFPTNLFNYYLIDGASALPVLAMDIKDGDNVADFCAAPGGKSLLMSLMLKDCQLFLNDISQSRFERLNNVFHSFIPKKRQSNIQFSNNDACQLKKYNQFDKILVDVPCTNDRHSLYSTENNIFSTKRLQERINLPMKQMDLLYEALKSVKIGGTVIYSTCSLSPIQNDGVIHMTLKKIQQTTDLDFSVVNFKMALKPFKTLFQFDFQFKYGVQIVPNLENNFGPMYFCKLIRNN